MSSIKCPECGLVNFAADEICRRCSQPLWRDDSIGKNQAGDAGPEGPRTLGKRLAWIAGMSLAILFTCYISLRLTSDPPNFQQRQVISRAIAVLDAKGFSREASVLGTVTSFRTSDNWWNIQTGHKEAYAATNFPFEIVTLYSEFFDVATDDTERAAILLHEAHHLLGSGEEQALESTWRERGRLGWTADSYSSTKVWKNTRELTQNYVPRLFQCGSDQRSDCVE